MLGNSVQINLLKKQLFQRTLLEMARKTGLNLGGKDGHILISPKVKRHYANGVTTRSPDLHYPLSPTGGKGQGVRGCQIRGGAGCRSSFTLIPITRSRLESCLIRGIWFCGQPQPSKELKGPYQ